MTSPNTAFPAEPIPEEALVEVARLLSSGDLFRYNAAADGPVALLEREFADLTGARFALAVSSCSAAIFLSLRALDLPPGARVVVPAFTFAAVPSAILQAGCTPLLVECGDDYRIDLDDLGDKLPQADGVVISHMRGHAPDMDAILAAAAAHGVPVVEDAAHALGATWRGRALGTLGRIGCFSFQSYKLLNAGEGGMFVTDDADLIARAVIMSGAYERNWRKHPVLSDRFRDWQNALPIYNLRVSNLAAAVLRPQLPHVARRVEHGRRNHDRVAARLSASPWFEVPGPLPGEERAPDSIQFNLVDATAAEIQAFASAAAERGLALQVFGLDADNARAFWNWRFLADLPELPKTRAMLERACDLRLPAHLSIRDCDAIADALIDSMAATRARGRAVA